MRAGSTVLLTAISVTDSALRPARRAAWAIRSRMFATFSAMFPAADICGIIANLAYCYWLIALPHISFAQDSEVMFGVSGNDVSQSPHSKRISAGNAGALPRLRRKIAEERNRSRANLPILVDVARPRDRIRLRRTHGNVLVKAGQRT